ncbi:hypothetical protein, partial [Lactobacillus helveticus]|uniref:hypothetical protein n=1 Tax=Lactobacillus helveticus TaxID=1587 RepID=UPI001C26D550
ENLFASKKINAKVDIAIAMKNLICTTLINAGYRRYSPHIYSCNFYLKVLYKILKVKVNP